MQNIWRGVVSGDLRHISPSNTFQEMWCLKKYHVFSQTLSCLLPAWMICRHAGWSS